MIKMIKINCKNCGEEFSIYSSKKETKKFCSRECYRNWKINNWKPKEGKKRSEKSKNKQSETRKRLFKEGKLKIWCDGLTKEIDERVKIMADKKREIEKRLYVEGKIHPMLGRHHTEESKRKITLARLNIVYPRRDTKIEVMIQNILKERYIKFRTHEPIFGQPDIFIEPNICIFVDGCYWHGCEQCYDRNNFDSIQRKNIIRDQLITQKLINDGYIILRFWEHEIKRNVGSVLERICSIINLDTPHDRLIEMKQGEIK